MTVFVMPSFLLRLEAVNFSESCYDTCDISTIRGGSMMLSNAHELARVVLPQEIQHEPTSFGASHAIWQFEAADANAAEKVRNDTLHALAKHKQLRHATFVCAVVANDDGSADALHRLRMHNHWRQYQEPTVVPPDLPDAKRQGKRICELDHVRPATMEIRKGNDSYWVSTSTYDRRVYGRKQKRMFYKELCGSDLAVVHDLSDLTSHLESSQHRLHGKMALIYIDGNQQSEMAADLSLDRLSKFRQYVREQHRRFLTTLLEEIVQLMPAQGSSNEWFHWDSEQNELQVRLETLLWGGDDIVLVVPAWKGWYVARKFYEAAQGWEFGGQKFTHATGLIYCSHKAPIQDMRRYAEDLVVQCKKTKNSEGNYQDLMGYEVLESIDVISSDLDRWRSARLGESEKSGAEAIASALLLSPAQMDGIESMIRSIRVGVDDPDSILSRRQIERRARRMQHSMIGDEQFDSDVTNYFAGSEFEKIGLGPHSLRAKLFHLTAMWDYLT
ncbi:conserved hypothetical protein [Pirellula staleyi DSM 6068]|uniref:Uncharacterized protein n=1 Tax=Pirellula staleyi (strain ATCC 27377 / DSM 6068 / ICPB 4128) TaxID=530564 RepID=D2R8Z5_PIRSD|nr:hypothetical protein [Pirellula staleyi]ADB15822.1 conserved hypothetical protein [Pirellula staleyi DSM 6068]